MKILILFLFLVPFIGLSQTDLKQSYKQYIEYCNETVADTIEEYGELSATKEVPIYGPCDEIIGYREVITGDTTWKGYKCKEYMEQSNYWTKYSVITCDSVMTYNKWPEIHKLVNKVCKVTRKHICTVKREKPSAEGFYQWLYKQIAK